jgi:IS30 family transposase
MNVTGSIVVRKVSLWLNDHSQLKTAKNIGHCEIDTVEGQKSGFNALLTFIERKTRNYYAVLLDNQDHDSVDYAMNRLQLNFGELFPKIFKTITSDNGSEFSNLTIGL